MFRPGEYQSAQASQRYRHLERDRQSTLDEARKCAALTIPWVCPPYNYRSARVVLPKPNQGLGARGVDNLVGIILGVLMPPGMPFFKLGLQPKVEQDLNRESGEESRLGQVLVALSSHEMDIVTAYTQDGDRAGISQGFLHLPITGNVLLHELPNGGVRHFGINQYVVRRAADGKMLECLVAEATRFQALSLKHRNQIANGAQSHAAYADELIDVYTHIYRCDDDGRYYEYQEANGVVLEGTTGDYPEDACPWLALRWTYVSGEDYGRGLIEQVYKDLERYDHLCKALGEGAKNAAKLIWMVGGGGAGALVQKLSKAQSGDFVVGDAASIKALQQEKANDLQVALKEKESLKADLSQAFLLGTSIQRSGDRVTKFEVEYMARALQAVYANEYTVIGREFQYPYFNSKTAQLRRRGIIPSLPKEALKVSITTGIDALGRGSDQQALESFVDVAVKIAPIPETTLSHREIMRRSAANLGIKPDGLVPTDDDAAQQRTQQMQQQMMQSATPEIVKGLSAGALQQGQQNFEQQQMQQSPAPGAPTPSPQGPPT